MSSTTRQEILSLLASGKISADEAAEMLTQAQAGAPAAGATESSEEVAAQSAEEASEPVPARQPESSSPAEKSGKQPTWFRVRVSNLETGKNKVTVNIPIRMLKFGFTIASRFTPELGAVKWEEINDMMAENVTGMLVDVQDEDSNEHVQVYID